MLNDSQVGAVLKDWERLQWYYTIEISPGVFTKGFEFNNIALTRRMLDNIDLKGRTAIDISAMEGAMSTIMAKRGASVLSTDAIDRTEQVTLVQHAHDVKFAYFPDIPLHRLAEHVFELQASKAYSHGLEIGPSEQTKFGFDVVLSSGVMYHVMNPVDHFMTYRKLCKQGGLVVLETAAAVSDDVSLFHAMRPDGTLYNGFATWFVSTAAIDLFLRACYLDPLAFCYVSREKTQTVEIARVGIVSRAVSTPPFYPQRYKRYNEVYHSELYHNKDFAMLQPAALLTGCVSNPLELRTNDLHSAVDGLSVAAFDGAAPLVYSEDDLRLHL
jgi:SAM-dependent methyltransferase